MKQLWEFSVSEQQQTGLVLQKHQTGNRTFILRWTIWDPGVRRRGSMIRGSGRILDTPGGSSRLLAPLCEGQL